MAASNTPDRTCIRCNRIDGPTFYRRRCRTAMILSNETLPDLPPLHLDGDVDPGETEEWLESLDAVVRAEGRDRARFLLEALLDRARQERVRLPFTANTPYVNTIPAEEQPPYPGD